MLCVTSLWWRGLRQAHDVNVNYYTLTVHGAAKKLYIVQNWFHLKRITLGRNILPARSEACSVAGKTGMGVAAAFQPVPYQAAPCQAAACQAEPCQAEPCQAESFHLESFHLESCRPAVPCHPVPYWLVPCHPVRVQLAACHFAGAYRVPLQKYNVWCNGDIKQNKILIICIWPWDHPCYWSDWRYQGYVCSLQDRYCSKQLSKCRVIP